MFTSGILIAYSTNLCQLLFCCIPTEATWRSHSRKLQHQTHSRCFFVLAWIIASL